MNLNHFYHYYKSKSGGVSNLLKASEDFTSSLDWLKKPDTDAPTITGGVTDPNGGTDAQRVNFTANRQSRVQQSVTLSASTQYTFSVYARVNTGTDQFRLRNVTLSAAEAKTATTSWTRFEYTFTTTTGGVYELSIQNTENAAANIEFFGAMLNVGASANDYVKVDPSTGGSAPTPAYSGFGDVFGGVTSYYSLRKFTEAETLNAIRVRRSSDDTEQDIGFDANGDLDTTALLAFVGTGGTDNGFVTTFYDQSGNGNNATNATASEQPLVVSGGSTILDNGKPIIQTHSTANFDVSATLNTSNATTQFIVGKSEISGVIVNTFYAGGNKADFVLASKNGDTSNAFSAIPDASYLNGSSFTFTDRDTTYDNTTAQSLISLYWANPSFESLIKIGWTSTSWSMWSTQELIIFNNDQSGNISGIETNINDHFSIYP